MLAVVMRFDPLGLIHSVTVATAEGRKEGVCREEIKSTALGASKRMSCACQRPLTLPVPIRASQLVAVVEHRNCFDAEQADFTQAASGIRKEKAAVP
jgi:hypothetical protein